MWFLSGQRIPEMEPSRSKPRPAGHTQFQAVRRGRVYEEVVQQIQDFVTSGRLKPGDRLPPERELAQHLQVSRSSLRDAIRTLELMGLVRSRQGEGTVVCDVSPEALLAPLATALVHKRDLVEELLDVRKMIEPKLAARAALRASPEHIARLEDVLRRQKEKMLREEPAIQEDSEFHYTIALAAQNTVIRKIVDVLMDLLRDSRAHGLQVPARLRMSFNGHRRVLRAVRLHDPRAAEAAMRRHLREIEGIIMENLASG
jgi:GntR family transcriptional repressor for pyruvate dehydrogenase complex